MRSRNRIAPLIVTAIAGALLLSSAGAAVLVAEQERVALSDERGVLEAELTKVSAQREAEAKAAAERKAAADLRQFEIDYWEKEGFEPAGTEGIWWRFADESEYSCGYFSCAAVVVVASGGQCPSSVFVKANTLHGGVVTGRITGMIGALQDGDTGSTLLEATDSPDRIEVTEINCY